MRRDDALQAEQGKWTAFFYWSGIVLALICMGLVFAKNTALVARWERAPLPLCWIAGIGAMVAFALSELCEWAASREQKVLAKQKNSVSAVRAL